MRNRWVSLRMWHRLGSEKSEKYKSHLVKVRKNVPVFWDLRRMTGKRGNVIDKGAKMGNMMAFL